LLRRACVLLAWTAICGCERVLGLSADDTANASTVVDATCAVPDSSAENGPDACDGGASCTSRDADNAEREPVIQDADPPDSGDADATLSADADAAFVDAAADAEADAPAADAEAGPPPPIPSPTIRGGLPMPLAYWALDGTDFVPPHVMQARIGGFDGLVAQDEGQIGVQGQIGEGYGVAQTPVREAIVVPPRAVDPLDLTQAGTLSAWVRMDMLPSDLNAPESVLDKGGFGTDLAIEAVLDSTTTNRFAFYFGNSSVTSSVSLQAGTWYHVVASFEAQGQLCLYVDGTTKDCAAAGMRIHDVQPLKLGEGAYFTGRGLVGALDEVILWDVVLSDAQVQALHQLGLQGMSIVGN
jgi:hypothetical protein